MPLSPLYHSTLLSSRALPQVGVGGGGGEYVPQMGFGWSNGVALYLLNHTGTAAVMTSSSDDDGVSVAIQVVVLCVILITLGVLISLGYWYYTHRYSQGKSKNNGDDCGNDIHINILQHNSVKNSLI